MTPSAKEAPAKIFCQFHQKTDCVCIAPVTDNKALAYRLEHQIRLNRLLLVAETEEVKIKTLTEQSENCKARLEKLTGD